MAPLATPTWQVTGLGPVKAWWNPHRRRFWLLLALLLYTLGGFLLAPWVIQSQVIPRVAEYLGRPISLDKLHINPYVLSIDARGFRLSDADGSPMFGFDRLFVNFQFSSVFRLALIFREIRLEKPRVALTRDASGETNLGRFLADVAPPDSAPEPATGDSELLRLIIGELSIVNGAIELTDHVPQPRVNTHFAPINISISDLSTLPASSGRQKIVIATGPDDRVELSGSLQLNPLLLEGRIEGGGRYLPIMYRYVEDQVAFEVSEGRANFAFDYRIEVRDDGQLGVAVDDLDFSLRGIVMRTDDPLVEFLSLPDMALTSGRFRWPEQTVQIADMVIGGARLHVIRNHDGVLNLQQLMVPREESAPAVPVDEVMVHPLQGWSIDLGELNIADFAVTFEDQSLTSEPAPTGATINIVVKDISNRDGAQFPFHMGMDLDKGGVISLDGQFGVLPVPVLDSALKIDRLALQIAQPWVAEAARVEIDAGLFNADTRLQVHADEPLAFSGSLNIESLNVSDATTNERLVGWERLTIDQLAASMAGNSLEVSEISIGSPYVRILIAEDQTTNFAQLAVGTETAAPDAIVPVDAEAADLARAPTVTVGQVTVTDGSTDFTDLSLPLPFAVQIDHLQGQVSTLTTDSEEPANIELEGQVGEFGLATITGRLLPRAPEELTDIKLVFRNLDMPSLSPYTVKFAGRHIDAGKLDVALKYLVESGRLLGENSIVIRDLALGKKVDHPDAANLPLGLAVALLTGPDGAIDIDLPVSGDVNDPEFNIGGLVFRTFVNLITKAVTSPFRLLSGLVGVDAEDFDRIEFRPGQSELTPPELEKLAKLSEALTMRPGLGLELRGAVDPQADVAAMQTARVEVMIDGRLRATEDPEMDQAMLTRRRLLVLEALINEQLPELDVAVVKTQTMRAKDPAKPEGKQVLDELAYMTALEDRLIAAERVGEQDLDDLALARAEAIRDAVLALERVTIDTARTTVTVAENGWIPMKLELDAAD